MGGNSFPVDLILFGMIAAFLVLRLRAILGRRQGYERPATEPVARTADRPASKPAAPVIEGRAEPPAPARVLPDPVSPIGQALGRIRSIDASFQPGSFLDGAERAFAMIVAAFAAGNRTALHPLLSQDMYAAFETAIAARETAGQTQRTEIRAVNSATIEQASVAGSVAEIVVRFVSDQVNLTTGSDGIPVSGADAVMEITDVWTFERDLSTRDPAWRLIAARSA